MIELIVSIQFNGYFKIVERNLLHNYVNRSLPEQLPDMIPEQKLNLKERFETNLSKYPKIKDLNRTEKKRFEI